MIEIVEIFPDPRPEIVEILSGSELSVIEVESPAIVEILELGLPGPKGDPASGVLHVQSSASADWTFNHNLGYWPDVVVLSSGGAVVGAEVVNTSLNQCHVYFSAPATGSARAI